MSNKSRPARWMEAITKAREGVEELREVQEEYEEWRDNLPENLEESTTAEKLDAIADLDILDMEQTLHECEGADLPRGFGRD